MEINDAMENPESLEERVEWLENDLRDAKGDIGDLQEDISRLKYLLETKGISW